MSIHDIAQAHRIAERIDPKAIDASWSADALAAFKQGLADGLSPDDVGGKIGQSFGSELEGVTASLLPASQLKRSEIFSMSANPSINTATVCAAIMAWGGMNQRFSKRFFSMGHEGWLSVADDIRKGRLDRKNAYDAFLTLRDNGKLHGVGPAYFTKIIYFLTPRSPETHDHAYIMDQWAGCSVNLLVSKELVKMDVARQWHKDSNEPMTSFRVSDANTSEAYENFCAVADRLRVHFSLSPDQVDRQMIGNGGRTKSSWRNYIIRNRSI